MNYSIIPLADDFSGTEEIIREYGANLEYNDFFSPEVYENEEEIERLISFYKSISRDRSGDTLHGAFIGLDISSDDCVVRDRSRALFRKSMQIAARLGVKGVVFHTGLLGGLNLRRFADRWLEKSKGFLRTLAGEFPDIDIYIENTFEQEPYLFEELSKELADVKNFGLCIDYAHASLTKIPAAKWLETLAPYVRHIHINDNDLLNDLHLAVGDGKIDFARFKFLLEKYCPDASVLVEVGGADKAKRSIEYLERVTPCENHSQSIDALGKILDIGIALTAERNPDKLLDMIVDTAMSLTESDGGTLYIVGNNALKFKIVKTRSKGVDMGGNGNAPDFPVIPLNKEHICAYSAITGKSMNISDVYNCTEFDFSGPKSFDCLNDYHTQSMVTIPLQNKSGITIGVLQLINAQTNGKVREFTAEEERIIRALGSQTAIALENMEYLRELNEQMWSFTEALTEAIDKRTPYNASHTRKVAEYSGMLADYINELHERGEEAEFFDEERRNQLIMSALLHDIGKLVIPKSVMNKATRLGDKLETLTSRLREILLKAEIALLRGRISESEYNTTCGRVKFCLEFVEKLNSAGFIDDETEKILGETAEYSFEDGDEKIKFFTEEELELLKIKRGTLSESERKIMESHALMTEEILKKVHFNSSFKNAGKWAAQHHECLNGKGYPYGLTAEELCLEVRILAVADICDALLATDRPYKKPLPKEKAFEIMRVMAAEGKIERRLVDYLEICLE